ncbi:MAG: phytase [Planctomycetota bacterium]
MASNPATARRLIWLLGPCVLLILAGAFYLNYRRLPRTAVAVLETTLIRSGGDALDDVCIWVAPDDPARSLIVGTDKKGGLAIYDLEGVEIDYLPLGKMNNVDLRSGFPFSGGEGVIVAATNKTDNRIELLRLDEGARTLVPVGAIPAPDDLKVDGLCLHHSGSTGQFHVVVTTKKGEFAQWRLATLADAGSGELVRRVLIGSETEGCVADDELGWLYVAEESVGIWKYPANPEDGEERSLVDSAAWWGRLRHDVEGLAIYRRDERSGYLVASNQGKDDFLVYAREGENDFAGRFKVVMNDGIDDVRHTDGIEIASGPLGPRFPGGALIVQDGKNEGENQNFKLVPWENVAATLHRLF